jgi:predicted nuclease of predicted toxin-antitoxin system
MKVLLDENISYRLIKKIQHLFEDCKHVNQVGLVEELDVDIWAFAQKNDYTIITFDADYQELSVLHGFPPKVIWLNTRNMRTEKLAQLLIDNMNKIQAFYQNAQIGF